MASAAIIAIFGLATAAANKYVTLLIIRFLVGVGVGGLVVPFDCVAEFVPTVRLIRDDVVLSFDRVTLTPLLNFIHSLHKRTCTHQLAINIDNTPCNITETTWIPSPLSWVFLDTWYSSCSSSSFLYFRRQ